MVHHYSSALIHSSHFLTSWKIPPCSNSQKFTLLRMHSTFHLFLAPTLRCRSSQPWLYIGITQEPEKYQAWAPPPEIDLLELRSSLGVGFLKISSGNCILQPWLCTTEKIPTANLPNIIHLTFCFPFLSYMFNDRLY